MGYLLGPLIPPRMKDESRFFFFFCAFPKGVLATKKGQLAFLFCPSMSHINPPPPKIGGKKRGSWM